MNSKNLFQRALLAMAGLTASLSQSAVVCDFESPADLALWRFSVGSDSIGGTGSLIHTQAGGNSFAQLNYDFTPPVGVTNFEPRFVQAAFSLLAGPADNALAIRVAASSALARVRVIDSTGQIFQHAINPVAALETANPAALTRIVIKFGATTSFWGGAADGIFHLPAKLLIVLAEGSGRRGTGWVRFDQVELLNYQPAPVVLEDILKHLVTPTIKYGTLSERLGVSVHFYQDDRAMDIIKSAGFKWIRMDLKWELAEKVAGTYDFSFFRNLVTAAEARGLRTLGILGYGNALHTGDRMTPPTTPDSIRAFAEFSAAAVAALSDTGTCYEIWNEPDLATFWGGPPSALQYGELVKATTAKIKAGGFKPVVLTAGLTAPGTPARAFLQQLESNGATATTTGLGMHLYTQLPPETRLDDILELSGDASRSIPAGKLWCTEWGYSSTLLDPLANGHSDGSRQKQAVQLTRMLLVGWLANLPLLNVYDIRDDGADATNKEYNYGLLDRNYVEKPALKAVRTLTGLAANRKLSGTINPAMLPMGLHAARLEGAADVVWIIWLDSQTLNQTISLVLPTGYLRVTDLFGSDLPVVISGGKSTARCSVDSGPIYLHLAADGVNPPSEATIQVEHPTK